MSELKAVKQSDVMWGHWFTEYYLKSEADKVIAELEMKLAAAQQVLRLNETEALFSNLETMGRLSHERDVVARRERHHKYKRCLAMAKLCHWKMGVFIYKEEKSNFYHRWFKRWLKIAKKFKEAK